MTNSNELYFEDFTPGRSFHTRGATLTEAQIIDFAWANDPQPFHINKQAAAESFYGGIIASGIQTLIVAFRLFYAENIINTASMGSSGIDELKWRLPVRPDDTLHVEAKVLESRPSRSKSDRGTVRIAYAVLNQRDETVMSFITNHIFRRRPG